MYIYSHCYIAVVRSIPLSYVFPDAENINTFTSGQFYRRAARNTEIVHVVLSGTSDYTCCK